MYFFPSAKNRLSPRSLRLGIFLRFFIRRAESSLVVDHSVALNPKLHSRFLEINEAYDALNTPHKRDMYELSRMERLAEELEARSNQRYHRYGRPLEKESKKKEIRWTVIISGVKYTVNPFSGWTLLSLLLSSWLILSLVIYVLLILSW